jgi:hypothetical protein
MGVSGVTTPIERNQEADNKVYDADMRAVSGTLEANDRGNEDVAFSANAITTDRNVPDSVHPVNNAGSDTERNTKKSKEALELDVKGKTSSLVRHVEGKMPSHRGGAIAIELDYLQLEMQSGPGRELSFGLVTAVGDNESVVASGLRLQSHKSTTGLLNGQRIPGSEPGMVRDSNDAGRAFPQDEHILTNCVHSTELQLEVPRCEPGTDSGAAEENIENTAALGLELSQPYSAEQMEPERKRRRPRGGKQKDLTGGQRRAYQKAREAEPE